MPRLMQVMPLKAFLASRNLPCNNTVLVSESELARGSNEALFPPVTWMRVRSRLRGLRVGLST